MLFCCIYRSPSSLPSRFYDKLLSECDKGILSCHQGLMIVGDFNSDISNPSLTQTKLLNLFCTSLGLTHLILQTTRITETSNSVLDLIITNKNENFRNSSPYSFSGSDHHVVITELVPRGIKSKKPERYIKVRNFSKLSEEMLEIALNCNYIWEDVLCIDDIDDCVTCLNQIIRGLMDILCPSQWRQIRTFVISDTFVIKPIKSTKTQYYSFVE